MTDRMIVAGAGLAGLTAGFELLRRGFDVTILEARDRVGGRVWSVTLPDGEVAELGGEWIEPEYRALPALAEELRIETAEAGIDYRRREAVGPMAASIEEQEDFVRIARGARAALSEQAARDLSLGAFIEGLPGSDRQRATLTARLQGTFAQDLHRIALGPVRPRGTFGDHPAVYRRAVRGNQSIAQALAERLPDVRLEHVVESVRADGPRVVFAGRAGQTSFTLEGSGAVIALPAPVVARLRFIPSLPRSVLRTLNDLPMGVASKLVVPVDGEPSLRARQDLDIPFWCYVALGGSGHPRHVLTSFAGSPQAQAGLHTAESDPEPWVEQLRAMNPDLRLAGPPLMKAWAQDPFALGAYSAFDQPSVDRVPFLQRPVGRIALAGEHTAGEWSGTMEGAVRSGLRAAEQAAGLDL